MKDLIKSHKYWLASRHFKRHPEGSMTIRYVRGAHNPLYIYIYINQPVFAWCSTCILPFSEFKYETHFPTSKRPQRMPTATFPKPDFLSLSAYHGCFKPVDKNRQSSKTKTKLPQVEGEAKQLFQSIRTYISSTSMDFPQPQDCMAFIFIPYFKSLHPVDASLPTNNLLVVLYS